MSTNANAQAGVDYSKIKGFKNLMVEVSKKTQHLPERHGVYVLPTTNGHAGVYEYRGTRHVVWTKTKEGLGNKAFISMLMRYLGIPDPTGNYWFGGIGIDAFLMGGNDNGAHNGVPVVVTDEVSCGSDDFFQSPEAVALAASFERTLIAHNVALVQGESPAYKYLMNATLPVQYAPSLSVDVVGITTSYISGEKVRPGDVIVVFEAAGWHANGASVIIKACLNNPDILAQPCGKSTFGEQALIPTRSYINLVQALTSSGVDVHAFLPMTGSGVGKFASDSRYAYVIDNWWVGLPPIMKFMYANLRMSQADVLSTFNCGAGYAAIMPKGEAERALYIASRTPIIGEEGYHSGLVAGKVLAGKAVTHFVPWDIYIPPPGE
jgi:phosphoribosylformylglycinamidine cyclo-ligase